MSKNKRLQKALAYQFSDEKLLQLALSHRSASKQNNERLEFLGDALLDLIISEVLFTKFPAAKEGELTRSRAALVRGETLAEIAREINLGEYILLGSGELKSGGFRRESILSDALEALFGAIYLDGGLESCRATVLALYTDRLATNDVLENTKDSKTRLQEWLQAKKKPLPSYVVLNESGTAHDKEFTVKCELGNPNASATATGASKRIAEMAAAEQILQALQSQ